jgi:hypothetical protein
VVEVFPLPLVIAKVYFVPDVPAMPKVNNYCPNTLSDSSVLINSHLK